jgi:hypothetical protein
LAQTPIWDYLRRRRVHVYGIGPPKTGTNSIARIFECSYRAGHEHHLEYTITLAFLKLEGKATEEEVKRALKRRESWDRLECESNALLIYSATELADLFPDAKFLCTVRSPMDWMRSAIDQHLNVSRSDRAEPNARTLRPWLYNVLPRGAYPEEEKPLAEAGAWNVRAYLDFWTDHYERALDLPRDRVLFLRTRNISSSIERIAKFIGNEPARLSRSNSHANRTEKRNGVMTSFGGARFFILLGKHFNIWELKKRRIGLYSP